MTNQQRFHKAKKLISEARKLIEPINQALGREHDKKYELRYSESDPLPPNWEYCKQISDARCDVISMIVDLRELENKSIAMPL